MADDPCSVGDDGFSLFASARPAKKKKSKSSRKARGKADAVGGVDVDEADGNATDGGGAIEAAPPPTPAASKALAKGTAEASDDEDDAPVTFKSLGLSDWLCRYDFVFIF